MTTQIPKPTDENCKWVTSKLLGRNPNLWTDLKPEHVFKIMLTVWIAAHEIRTEKRWTGKI
jgi:hypothetical protein